MPERPGVPDLMKALKESLGMSDDLNPPEPADDAWVATLKDAAVEYWFDGRATIQPLIARLTSEREARDRAEEALKDVRGEVERFEATGCEGWAADSVVDMIRQELDKHGFGDEGS